MSTTVSYVDAATNTRLLLYASCLQFNLLLEKEMLQQTFVQIYTTLLLANVISDYVKRNLHSNYRRTIHDPIINVSEPIRGFVCMTHETTGDRHHTEGVYLLITFGH